MTKRKGIILGIIVFLALFTVINFGYVQTAGGKIANALYPVFIGIIVALVLNAPVRFLERRVFFSPKLKKCRRFLSFFTTLLILGGVGTLLGFLVAPSIRASIVAIGEILPEWNAGGLKALAKDSKFLLWVSENLGKVLDSLAGTVQAALPKAAELLKNAVKMLANFLVGLGFGALILFNKEQLLGQLKRVLHYFFGDLRAKKTVAALAAAGNKFSRFLSGQAVEAFIFGLVCYGVFALFRLPHAPLVALLAGLGNLIPMLGAYIAGALAFLFIFTVSPEKAFLFILLIVVIQQIEQYTTYPVIVGRYVGLSSFWMLFSVIVGGSLFGFWGLLLAVPAVAFFHNFFAMLYDKKVRQEMGDADENSPFTNPSG